MRRVNAYRKKIDRIAGLVLGLGMMGLTANAQAEDIETVKVVAKEFEFQPATIEMEAGETVRLKLVNKGQLSHNLHLRGVSTNTETIQAGNSDTVRVTASENGTLEFYCDVPGHKQAGMTGKIIAK